MVPNIYIIIYYHYKMLGVIGVKKISQYTYNT